MLDRGADIHVWLPAVKVEKLTGEINSELSAKIQARVQKTRLMQEKRFEGTSVKSNHVAEALQYRPQVEN